MDAIENEYGPHCRADARRRLRRKHSKEFGGIDEAAIETQVQDTSAEARKGIGNFDTNCLHLEGNVGAGLFAQYSRLNHLCEPNVVYHYNRKTRKLSVRAVRHINVGEELLTTYLSTPARRTREQRADLLRRG